MYSFRKSPAALGGLLLLLCVGALYSYGGTSYDAQAQGGQDRCRPKKEACNGVDDDCDGQTDEGVAPQSFYTGPAGTEGVGVCRAGTRACASGSFGVCQQEVTPGTEACGNNADDDCDGLTDEAGCTPSSVCGNGVVEAPEECDDGNASPGDGCTPTCRLEQPPASR